MRSHFETPEGLSEAVHPVLTVFMLQSEACRYKLILFFCTWWTSRTSVWVWSNLCPMWSQVSWPPEPLKLYCNAVSCCCLFRALAVWVTQRCASHVASKWALAVPVLILCPIPQNGPIKPLPLSSKSHKHFNVEPLHPASSGEMRAKSIPVGWRPAFPSAGLYRL